MGEYWDHFYINVTSLSSVDVVFIQIINKLKRMVFLGTEKINRQQWIYKRQSWTVPLLRELHNQSWSKIGEIFQPPEKDCGKTEGWKAQYGVPTEVCCWWGCADNEGSRWCHHHVSQSTQASRSRGNFSKYLKLYWITEILQLLSGIRNL